MAPNREKAGEVCVLSEGLAYTQQQEGLGD